MPCQSLDDDDDKMSMSLHLPPQDYQDECKSDANCTQSMCNICICKCLDCVEIFAQSKLC